MNSARHAPPTPPPKKRIQEGGREKGLAGAQSLVIILALQRKVGPIPGNSASVPQQRWVYPKTKYMTSGEKMGRRKTRAWVTATQLPIPSWDQSQGNVPDQGQVRNKKWGTQESGKGKREFLDAMHGKWGGKAYRPEKTIPIDCPCRPRWNPEAGAVQAGGPGSHLTATQSPEHQHK